jgi:hypothetical protein
MLQTIWETATKSSADFASPGWKPTPDNPYVFACGAVRSHLNLCLKGLAANPRSGGGKGARELFAGGLVVTAAGVRFMGGSFEDFRVLHDQLLEAALENIFPVVDQASRGPAKKGNLGVDDVFPSELAALPYVQGGMRPLMEFIKQCAK